MRINVARTPHATWFLARGMHTSPMVAYSGVQLAHAPDLLPSPDRPTDSDPDHTHWLWLVFASLQKLDGFRIDYNMTCKTLLKYVAI